ncbi:Afadin [Larimichthys crocea]|uniref:Uncharacterized protein n=1 Tax=Larimichthys crocea TaxID=215358 RepID=A0ACD3R0J0_LARCR|nr:Afadin [Larimichthys crocea]
MSPPLHVQKLTPSPPRPTPGSTFTIPASKSQDRVVGPGQGPSQHWQGMEDRERLPVVDNIHNSMQRVNHSQEELYPPPGGLRPEERMQQHYQQDYQHRDMDYQHRELDYQRGGPPGVGGPDHWTPQPQVSSSLESSTSSQEHLNFSASSSSSNKTQNQKTGPGRWKTPNAPHSVPPHSAQPPSRSDLPPPPPPPPATYPESYDPYDPQPDLPLPPPPSTVTPAVAQQAADRKKREEQQRWYEKEKARLEEERPEKLASLPRSAVPPPASASNPAGMDTVIRELLPQQQPRTIERRDLQYITISKEELTSSDSLSPDPWKRDAREKAEKQQQLHIVDLLDKEIQELQAKPERTAEESDRLRKLMLEWQFQKRLQESKQSDEDEEEEDDEDVDTMMIMQRLEAEKRARQQNAVPAISVLDLRRQEEEYYTRLEAERRRQHDEAERKLLTPDDPAGFNSYTGNSAGVVGSGEVYKDPRDKWTKSQEQENSNPSGPPENLTFKERQRLFSQGKEVSNKVKASRKLMELENELNTK